MSHSTEKQLEHAEHVQHAAHNPFDSKVAVSMSILAAVLAGVTLASHRGHTDTLRLATEATAFHTKASDTWNEYQAKNIRSHEFKSFLTLDSLLAPSAVRTDPESQARRKYWIGQIDKYEGEGSWERFDKAISSGKEKPKAGEKGDLGKLSTEAKALQAKGNETEEQSHRLHGLVTWIDFGHFGLELALVFCAVAVLTKSRKFWMIGIVIGVLGALIAAYGMVQWRFFFEAGGAVHH